MLKVSQRSLKRRSIPREVKHGTPRDVSICNKVIGNGQRIVVQWIDDQEDILQTTAIILKKDGHEVVTASDGFKAIDAVRASRPDLVLLDIEMPRMDGWETLRLLRLEETTRGVPVAMFTILFDVNEKVRALKLGAQEYITKPFEVDDLLTRIQRVLTEAESQRGIQ